MSFRSGGGTLNAGDVEGRRPGRARLLQGFFNNLPNPKGALFYLGVFTRVITPETSASTMLVLVLCMMLVSASFWLFIASSPQPERLPLKPATTYS